ncbi:rhodanese-like domain-containing protein [Rothia nasimurium]|uniref:rhodanese-like domain-containing protein n=1 Tax=Rothia nasimurium TaxID=85336 RepID=UPI0016271144|nr:rhodanese-like domain-containing protein [Rothia nasimurium]
MSATPVTLPSSLDAPQLAEKMKAADGTLLLDVRTVAEYKGAHIPGSINVPLSLIEKHPEELSSFIENEAVIICRSGARAQRAQKLLTGVGVTHTSVLTGGMEAWKKAEQAVNVGPARWDLERQVRLVAGSLVAGSVAASVVFPRAKYLAGAVGGGLTFAAVSNTCAMGSMLSRLPYNKSGEVSLKEAKRRLAAAHAGQ